MHLYLNKLMISINKINQPLLAVCLLFSSICGAADCFKWIEWNWSTMNSPVGTLKGKSAKSVVDDVTYTSVVDNASRTTPSTILISPLSGGGAGEGIFNYAKFKSNYDSNPNTIEQYGEFPVNRQVVKNTDATFNTLRFDTPVNNIVLIFASVGSGILPVTVKFDRQIEIIYGGIEISGGQTLCSTQGDSASSACVRHVVEAGKIVGFTAREGYIMIKIPGENISTLSFSYTAENWVNFLFGYIPSTCGDGSLECGEQCDLGKRNGITTLGCNALCKAEDGFECSGLDNLTSWAKIFNERIKGLSADCFTDTGCTINNETSSGGLITMTDTQIIQEIKSQSIHIIAQNIQASACTGGGKEGKYAKLVLKDLKGVAETIVIKCTNEKIDLLDMQTLRKKTARPYTQIADKKCSAASTTITNLVLDGNLQSCQLYCDDNKTCKFAVETTVGTDKKCSLYSSCTQENAPGVKLFQFNG